MTPILQCSRFNEEMVLGLLILKRRESMEDRGVVQGKAWTRVAAMEMHCRKDTCGLKNANRRRDFKAILSILTNVSSL